VLDVEGKPVPDVWAVGDAAIIKSDGPPFPATAQVASQKAKVSGEGNSWVVKMADFAFVFWKYLTDKLNAQVKDREHNEPFVFRNQGSLAYLGDW
jgi:NADH dehydrogenase FAD-containing subunit